MYVCNPVAAVQRLCPNCLEAVVRVTLCDFYDRCSAFSETHNLIRSRARASRSDNVAWITVATNLAISGAAAQRRSRLYAVRTMLMTTRRSAGCHGRSAETQPDPCVQFLPARHGGGGVPIEMSTLAPYARLITAAPIEAATSVTANACLSFISTHSALRNARRAPDFQTAAGLGGSIAPRLLPKHITCPPLDSTGQRMSDHISFYDRVPWPLDLQYDV